LFREFPPTLLQPERFLLKLRQLHQLINSKINSCGNFFPRKSARNFWIRKFVYVLSECCVWACSTHKHGFDLITVYV
jgi:hypothetical protein